MKTECVGYCRKREDGFWWVFKVGKPRGPAVKGWSPRIIWKWIVINDEECKDGMKVTAYHDSKKDQPFILIEHYITGNIICLKVADNGLGIPKEYQTKVFDMFFRANEKSKGSGLGLYIVKEAIMKLSGSIQLDSEAAEGSTFTIRLPL